MKNFLSYIDERRSNPELNPKLSAFEQLRPFANQDDIYITFTALEKVGVNPRSIYNTPIGVYTYPLKEVWKEYKIEDAKGIRLKLPFVSHQPYIHVLKGKHSKSFIKDIDRDYSLSDFNRDVAVLKEINEEMTNEILRYVEPASSSGAYGIAFWLMTKQASSTFRQEFKFRDNNPAVAWTALFRKMGYTGMADKSGKGIIFSSEPIQAVFLVPSEYTVLKTIVNKDYK
jgi:hypothetical protein